MGDDNVQVDVDVDESMSRQIDLLNGHVRTDQNRAAAEQQHAKTCQARTGQSSSTLTR